MHPRRLLVAFSLLSAATCAKVSDAAAQANVAPGLWRLSAFNDASPGMSAIASHTLCFLPNGTWFGTTFPNWGGRWFQKGANAAGNGDRVRLLGNYAGGLGNDGAELHFFNANLMAGAWTEWRDPASGQFVAWATVTLTRAGDRCPPQPRMAPAPQAREERRNPVGGE
ncbi:MAG: hypothetical protein ACJ8J0_23995 [Longimicrobiaceae bacterium]